MPAIIGTAGHIDHGKTALIRALTGQDTDRLKEEKERGISIDLGFAYLARPGGERAGIVDVPGHERFIRNMLAGAHGMDLLLLVVAADDGVMPQTEEHLEILHLLGVRSGIAVITKSDLVPSQRLAEVREEIEILLDGSSLQGAPAIAVSSLTGAGIDDLRTEIERQLATISPERPAGYFRLPVDRAFVMHGHGVVVTGTAVSGVLREGDGLRLQPGGEVCRVRHIEVHGESCSRASAGQRVALNLSGVERTDVRRGHVLVDPALSQSTDRLDALVEICPGARRPIKSHTPVRFYLGTAERMAKLILLEERTAVAPKESACCQLILQEPVLAVHGDRFILRNPTGQTTLGGGRVLQPFAHRYRRRAAAGEGLRRLAGAGGPAEALRGLVGMSADGILGLPELRRSLNLPEGESLALLGAADDLVLLPEAESAEVVATAEAVRQIESAIRARLDDHHRAVPLSPGVEMESLRSQVAPGLAAKLFRSLIDGLEHRRLLARDDSLLRLPSHRVSLGAEERQLAARAESLLAAAGFTPPDLREIEADLGVPRRRLIEILSQLEREHRLARIAPELYFARAPLERARELLAHHLSEHGEITAATFRDLIRASRKFSIALLDYFDRTGFTLRVGDVRKLRGQR